MTADTLVLPTTTAPATTVPRERGWFQPARRRHRLRARRASRSRSPPSSSPSPASAWASGCSSSWVGVAVLAATLLAARGFATLERAWLPAVLRRPLPRPAYLPPEGSRIRQLLTPLRDPQTWLDALHAVVRFPLAIFSFVVTVTFWSVALGGLTYGAWDWALPDASTDPDNQDLLELLGLESTAGPADPAVHRHRPRLRRPRCRSSSAGSPCCRPPSGRAMLTSRAATQAELGRLTEGRNAAVAAEAVALRRLERDIHDGPQQRLVRLAMDLARAQRQLERDPGAARATLGEAAGLARETLEELRALSRGIAPPVLADRGLAAALAALAARSAVPVDLDVDLPAERLAPVTENTAYFVVSEALANVAKHSDATTCRVERPVHRRPAAGRRGGRRQRRRGARPGARAGRAHRPAARRRRRADRGQPPRRPDAAHGGAAVRVILAEDSVLLREGLVRLLEEAGTEVVAAVGDGPSLVRAVREHRPDVAVVDVRMPPTHTDEGLRAAVEARQAVPGTAVLVLSQYVEVAYADELLADGAGGVGYLLKDRVADVDTFLTALEDVVGGGTVLDPQVVAQLFARRRADDPVRRLTPREREVLGLIAEGHSNTAIAPHPRRHPRRGGEAHPAHLREARPRPGRRPAPPGDGDAGLPARLNSLAGCRRRPVDICPWPTIPLPTCARRPPRSGRPSSRPWSAAFGETPTGRYLDTPPPVAEMDRSLGLWDGDRVVATAGIYSRDAHRAGRRRAVRRDHLGDRRAHPPAPRRPDVDHAAPARRDPRAGPRAGGRAVGVGVLHLRPLRLRAGDPARRADRPVRAARLRPDVDLGAGPRGRRPAGDVQARGGGRATTRCAAPCRATSRATTAGGTAGSGTSPTTATAPRPAATCCTPSPTAPSPGTRPTG